MPKITKITIFTVLFFILGVFYLSLTRETNYNTSNLISKEVPEFKIVYFNDSNYFTNQDLKKNKYTLINFWASWCYPCKIEHPILIKLSKENKLKMVGVNFKDKSDQALQFLDSLSNPYDILLKDTKGKQSVNFGIYGIPESILVNEKSTIIKKFVGPLSIDDYREIKKVIN